MAKNFPPSTLQFVRFATLATGSQNYNPKLDLQYYISPRCKFFFPVSVTLSNPIQYNISSTSSCLPLCLVSVVVLPHARLLLQNGPVPLQHNHRTARQAPLPILQLSRQKGLQQTSLANNKAQVFLGKWLPLQRKWHRMAWFLTLIVP